MGQDEAAEAAQKAKLVMGFMAGGDKTRKRPSTCFQLVEGVRGDS